MTHENMDALLAPDSIAIVGASPDSWYASRLIDNLLSYGYRGEVYYVNPGREEIRGEPCYDAITDLPTVVDLAVVSIPREYVVETVEDAASMGVPAAIVISAGFGEADATGRELEADLASVAEEHGIALCGPNTIGLANMQEQTVISATCTREPEPGSIALVSQSGALSFSTFYDRATDEDLNFSAIVATGNEAGLSVTDYVEYLADDPTVSVICTYIEGLEAPRRFMEAAAEATANGTPVLSVKIGQTEDAERASVSHTGSITGDDDAWTAAFEQTGVQRVRDIPDLLERANVHSRYDPPDGGNVCIASTSGGLASLLADLASQQGLGIPPLSPDTEATLVDRDDLLTFGSLGNPADIRGYGAEILPEIAETMFADDRFDAYLFAIGMPAVGERGEPLIDDLLTVAEMATDPVVFLWTGRKEPDPGTYGPDEDLPYERLRRKAPLFYDPGRAVDALGSLIEYGDRRDRVSIQPWHEASQGDRRSPVDLPADAVPDWESTAAALRAGGIEPVRTERASSPDEAASLAADIGYPVAMKADPGAVAHRTDVGAVTVDVDSDAAAKSAYEGIASAVRTHGDDTATENPAVLIQPMVDGVEVLVGATREPGFGPVLTVGPGGALVELFEEQAVFIPPVDKATVRRALADGPMGTLLDGHRGSAPIDPDRLVELIVDVGDLLLSANDIEELDLNPVILTPEDLHVVDALIRTRSA